MAIVNIGGEGEKTLTFGKVLFTFDSAWSKYEEAFSREYSLTKAGYSVRRTELVDVGGKLSKRGIDTLLYLIWTRKGHVEKTPGRKPKRK
jgi:hypothetical protein